MVYHPGFSTYILVICSLYLIYVLCTQFAQRRITAPPKSTCLYYVPAIKSRYGGLGPTEWNAQISHLVPSGMTEGSELVKFRVILLKGLRGVVVRAWAFHSVGTGSNPKGTWDFSCSSGLCLHGLPSRVVNLHISYMQFISNKRTM